MGTSTKASFKFTPSSIFLLENYVTGSTWIYIKRTLILVHIELTYQSSRDFAYRENQVLQIHSE